MGIVERTWGGGSTPGKRSDRNPKPYGRGRKLVYVNVNNTGYSDYVAVGGVLSTLGTGWVDREGTLYPPYHLVNHGGSNDFKLRYNKAVSKHNEQLQVGRSLFEDWYERKQAYELMLKSLSGVLHFVRNWKNPKFYSGIAAKGRAGKLIQPKDLPSAWLQYSFGVKPLMGLADDCLRGLVKPVPSLPVTGVSSFSVNKKFSNNIATPWNTDVEFHLMEDYIIKVGSKIRPDTNPNLALTKLVGALEPVSTFLSVVPWGWAVEYFVNLSEIASNFELSHPGVHVYDTYVTLYCRSSRLDFSGTHSYWGHKVIEGVMHSKWMGRSVLDRGGPSFQLAFNYPRIGSSRFANLTSAIALTMKGKR